MSHGNNLQLDIIAEFFTARRGRRDVLVVEESAQIPFRPNGLVICQRQGRLMVCTPKLDVPFGPLNGTMTLTFTAVNLGAAISAISSAGLRRQGKVTITSIVNLKGALEVTLDIADDVFDQVLAILRGIPGVTLPATCTVTSITPTSFVPLPIQFKVGILINGTGLTGLTAVKLDGPTLLGTREVRAFTDEFAVAIFTLNNPPLGIYDVVAVTLDGECRLTGAFTFNQ